MELNDQSLKRSLKRSSWIKGRERIEVASRPSKRKIRSADKGPFRREGWCPKIRMQQVYIINYLDTLPSPFISLLFR
ncbi:hypothetical protein I7I48_10713 [Histoplasma ohiense]|nr:hypothetical protein I7I48_10713 [Histoplasma ohiense (nom. inval.)]